MSPHPVTRIKKPFGACGYVFARLLLSLTPTWAVSQNQPVPSTSGGDTTYRLQVGTQAVVLDVVVTNERGEVVTNLSKDDFLVYENKVLRTIRTFDPPPALKHAVNPAIHSTAELDHLEPDAPVTLIVLDEINTSFQDEAFARYSLQQYLNKQGEVLDHPTLLGAVDLNRFTLLHDYTTSRQELLDALQKHKVIYPYHLDGASWRQQQFDASFEGLLEVTEATSGHAGHKSLLWVGRGFPPFDPTTLSDDDNRGIKHIIETCTNTMRSSRVVLYTLDPAGVTTEAADVDSEGFPEDPFDGELDFSKMAQATGGHAFYGRNDVDKLIDVSTNEGASFYTLSYMPKVPSTDTRDFRGIRIVMKSPNLKAETREGYYTRVPVLEKKIGNPKADRQVFDLGLAVQSTLTYDAVHINAKRVTDTSDQFRLTLKSSDLVWVESGSKKLITKITVVVETFDKKGSPLDHTIKLSTLQVGEGAEPNIPDSPTVSLFANVPLKPQAVRVRFVVRVEANQSIGAANVSLNGEALSGGK